MKKSILSVAVLLCTATFAYAQEADAATDAAKEIAAAADAAPAKPKFSDYWSKSLKTNVNIGQTGLVNWAAGGDNTVSLAAFIDGNANYKKDDMFWNNRLQLDYGFLYASSKPILQKSKDRIYLESKWGYQIKDKLYFSANYDLKSQFTKGYDYKTPGQDIINANTPGWVEGDEPGTLESLEGKNLRQAWRDARVAKSGFMSPAYTNLALGIDWKPKDWCSVSFAPLTGGYVIVTNKEFRKAYSMKLTKDFENEFQDYDAATATEEVKQRHDALLASGEAYRSARFEFGAQLTVDLKAKINDNFSYTTQIVLFEDYLKNHRANPCPRINWDNRIDWKIAKYFALTLTTNMIYDDMIMIKTDKWASKCSDEAYKAAHPDGVAALQFMESISFGFTWTIASKARK